MFFLLCWIVVLPAFFISASKGSCFNEVIFLKHKTLKYCYFFPDMSECGKISSPQLFPNSEADVPWAVHLVTTDETLVWAKPHPYPSILISPTLIFTSKFCVTNQILNTKLYYKIFSGARAFYVRSSALKILQTPHAYLAKFNSNITANVSL